MHGANPNKNRDGVCLNVFAMDIKYIQVGYTTKKYLLGTGVPYAGQDNSCHLGGRAEEGYCKLTRW